MKLESGFRMSSKKEIYKLTNKVLTQKLNGAFLAIKFQNKNIRISFRTKIKSLLSVTTIYLIVLVFPIGFILNLILLVSDANCHRFLLKQRKKFWILSYKNIRLLEIIERRLK